MQVINGLQQLVGQHRPVVAKEGKIQKAQEEPPKMNIDRCHTLGNATLQPLSTNLGRCSGHEISSRVRNQWKRDAQKLAGHLKAHLISQNLEATKSNAQDGCPIKRDDCILPIAQVKGAHLGMKLPHQSLPDPMPRGVRGDLQETLKSLLSQKLGISLVGPNSKQQPKKGKPSTPTPNLVDCLHSKSEAICQHMHITGI